ncbi:MAG: phospholipid-binding protein MlaC [Alphaproteobacteria bacterium]
MRIPAAPRLLLVVATVLSLGAGALAAETPKALIEDLGARAIKSLTGNVPRPERESRFRTLLREGFDVAHIGRFVLGRYWRQASPEQQRQYLDLFEKFIVQAYAARFAEYSGEQFRVVGERQDGGETIVTSEVFKPGSPATKVDWRVKADGAPKIVDVVVEGVSMAVTQRSEFAAVIQRNGGSIDALIGALRQKTSG